MSKEVRTKVFLDVESTGLNPQEDRLVELTYAVEQDDPITLFFGVQEVPDFIDGLIGFTDRGIAGLESSEEEVRKFLDASRDATMVSANPKFDAAFLDENELNVFHYRTLDLESYAMHALGLEYVPGMADIYELLTERGYDIVAPDHTSRNDVLALRKCFEIIKWQMPSGYLVE